MRPLCRTGKAVLFVFVLLLAGCSRQPRFGFIDRTGSYKIAPQFTLVRDFSEGLAPVMIDGKWGYIDISGRVVIAPQFGEALPFSDGLALVTTTPRRQYWSESTRFGYIDHTGKFVIPEKFGWARPFSEGLAEACLGDCRDPSGLKAPVGYIDRSGEFAIAPQFGSTRPFSEGVAAVNLQRGEKYGYIDRRGAFAITPAFVGTKGSFSNGLAPLYEEGYINRQGRTVIRFPRGATGFAKPFEFSDSFGRVELEPGSGGLTVFVDPSGREVLRGNCIESFFEGLAAACDEDYTFGFKDKVGKWVILPRWQRVGRFSGGLAMVCDGDCVD